MEDAIKRSTHEIIAYHDSLTICNRLASIILKSAISVIHEKYIKPLIPLNASEFAKNVAVSIAIINNITCDYHIGPNSNESSKEPMYISSETNIIKVMKIAKINEYSIERQFTNRVSEKRPFLGKKISMQMITERVNVDDVEEWRPSVLNIEADRAIRRETKMRMKSRIELVVQ